MKRAAAWAAIVAFIAFLVFWFAGGPRMFDGSNDAVEYGVFICVLLILGVGIFRLLYKRCPRCRRWIRTAEENCPHCSEEE